MKPPETQHKSVQPAGARVSIMTMTRRRVLGGLAAIAALPALMPLMGRAAEPLRIGIIGAGWLGSTVGKAWVRAGHEVMLSSRHPQALTDMPKQLGPRASVGTPAQAAEFGAVLLFAIPYEALPALGRDLHASLRGKIVLDACNAPAGGSALAQEAAANGVGQTSANGRSARAGGDLQLPGHTHGGMIRGFDKVVAAANQRYVSGVYRVAGMQLYVSNGTSRMASTGKPEPVGAYEQREAAIGCAAVVVRPSGST